jgi:lysophospholipase L1-like esterase
MTEADDPYCLQPAEAEAMLADAPWRRLLVLGDSIAVHSGDPVDGYANRTWVHRLAAALRLDECRNFGVTGARLADVRTGQLNDGLTFYPDLAVVAAGANDVLPSSLPVDLWVALERIIAPLSRLGALVVTFGCFDVGRTARLPAGQRAALSERLRTLSRVTEEVCLRHGGIHVDFADHPAQRDGVLSADLLHINMRGHAVVASEVMRALGARLSTGAIPNRTSHP